MDIRKVVIDYFGTKLEFICFVKFTLFVVCKDKSGRIYAYDVIPRRSKFQWEVDRRELYLVDVAHNYSEDTYINKISWKESLKYYSLLEDGTAQEITEEQFKLLKEVYHVKSV